MKLYKPSAPDATPHGIDHAIAKAPSSWQVAGQLFGYFWPKREGRFRRRFVGACVLMVLSRLAAIAMPLFFKQVIDDLKIITDPHPSTILPLAVGALLVAYGFYRIVTSLLGEVRDIIFSRLEYTVIYRIALQAFTHLQALSLRFHLDRKTGKITRIIERGTQAIERSLRFLTFIILPALLEAALLVGVLLYLYKPIFAIITAVTLVIYVGATLAISNWRLKYMMRMNEADDASNTKAIDTLLNYEAVKYYANEDIEEQRFAKAFKDYTDHAVQFKATLGYLNMTQSFIIAFGMTLSLLLTTNYIYQGVMTLGDLVLVNMYLMQIYIPMGNLGFAYRELKQSLVDIGAVFSLFDEPIEVKDKPKATALKVGRGGIRFEHVSFFYTPNRLILDDVTFRVPHGKTVAIVGPSGSGKSTIARLLCRFFDVTEGSIHVEGKDIRDLTQRSLRQALGVVPQDTVLFNDTLGYNIGYGNPTASQTDIIRAAKMAELDTFIEHLPQGYDTLVGERGLKLSGGEKQRVAIARAILKDPPIYVFDEATSSLDTKTEKAIHNNILRLSRGKTTLIIAHRLSTVVEADSIIVLVKGKIVEEGTHDDLLRQRGVYAIMWRQQEKQKEDHGKMLSEEIPTGSADEGVGEGHAARLQGDLL